MPEITKAQPGHFCWFEIGTTDAAKAKAFYADLFGWTGEDSPAGPGMIYTMLRKDGKDVGGLYELGPEMRAQGIPPHWLSYVSVGSADEAAAKAKQLGGKAMREPFDVMEAGRMAVLQDPQGAVFAVWQPKQHFGVRVYREPNAPCWVELATTDLAGATKFYAALFGWKADVKGVEPNTYTEWIAGDGTIVAGMLKQDPKWGANVPPHWLAYVAVTDCDATTRKTTDRGGRVLAGPIDMENVGKFAALSDPQGAAFAVITPRS